jgi:hypothetical protein
MNDAIESENNAYESQQSNNPVTNINVMSGSNSMFNLQHEINSVESSLVKLTQEAAQDE